MSTPHPCTDCGNQQTYIRLLLYVDDKIHCSNCQQWIETFEKNLTTEYKVSLDNLSNKFKGLDLELTEAGLFINQEKLIMKMAKEYEVETMRYYLTPLPENLKLDLNSTELHDVQRYQAIVGGILYVASNSRPDVAFSVNSLSSVSSSPTKEAYRLGKRVIKYLADTKNLCLFYPRNHQIKENVLECYSDASFASDPKSHLKSTAGWFFI